MNCASGGLIPTPDDPDRVPMMLHAGDYIIPAAAARAAGIEWLDRLNVEADDER